MKKLLKYGVALAIMALPGIFTSCSEFTPTGYEEVAELPTISNLRASVNNKIVDLSWNLPANMSEVVGLRLLKNADLASAINLDPTFTSYQVEGQPMQEEVVYTVKVIYTDERLSPGVSVSAVVPYEELADVTNLKINVSGRTVNLSWTLPNALGITGVRVSHNIVGESIDDVYEFASDATSAQLTSQPMGVDNEYTVQVVYDKYYPSPGIKEIGSVQYYEPKMGYLMTASSPDALPSDSERMAANWFSAQENAEFISPDQISSLDVDIYSVLWVNVERIGLEAGWQNLPYEISNDATMEALRNYTQKGGSLFLTSQATQLCEPLGVVPEGYNPNMFGSGGYGEGGDVWYINPYLGWDFQDPSNPQGFYDRSGHQVFQGLNWDYDAYDYPAIPLAGMGMRTDNNNMWDCNVYGNGGYADVIINFENVTGSTVLATWGHVRDHCVAGLVDFNPVPSVHGRCMACGFSAYQWYDNNGNNTYQSNIEGLTLNILKYLQ